MVNKCHKGEILRKSYTRKDGTKVKATCVPDKGVTGKTPKKLKVLPKLKEGILEKYGYSLKSNIKTREKALKKAIKEEGSLAVLKRLVVLRTYHKNNPLFNKFDKDVKFVQNQRKKIVKKVRFNISA